MSGSSAFANYSNTTQLLRQGVDQLAPTSTQITNDKANFEQQFLIGAALTAKTKAGEKFAGLLKKSKTLKNVKGAADDAIKSARQKVNDLATQLKSKIPGVSKPPPVPATNPAADDAEVQLKKDISDAATKKSQATKDALQDARDEVTNSADDLEVSKVGASTATDIADKAIKDATLPGNSISTDTIAAQKAKTLAKESLAKAQSRSDTAISEEARLSQLSIQHENEARGAAQDLKNAQQVSDDAKAASNIAQGANALDDEEQIAKVAKAASELSDLEKSAKAAKDAEEASAATDEADPLGFLVTAAAAAATQLIGRSIKAHENEISNIPTAPVSYTSTIGA